MIRLSRLLVALLCLCLLCPLGLAEESLVIVSVEQMEYRLGEVQAYYDALAKSACESNGVTALTEEQALKLRDAVVKQYVFQGVVQNMYAKLGLNTFTAEDAEKLREDAQKQYDELIASAMDALRQNYAGASEEKLLSYAVATLELQSVTLDTVYEAAKETAILERMLDYVTPGLTITDEQVENAYVEQYIAAEKEAFGENIYMYELYMYHYDYEPRYIPAGFRYVKQILLATPDRLQAELDAQQTVIDEAYAAVETAEAALKQLSDADEEETKQAVNDAYQEANRAYAAALEAQDAIKAKVLEAVKPTTDEIAARYAAGESFESLMDAYTVDAAAHSDDAPYLIHAASYFCDEALRDVATALEKPGDVSAPTWSTQGVHILLYDSDAPAYAPMDDAMRQAVYETLWETARYDALLKKSEEWRSGFSVFTYPDKIDITHATTERPAEEEATAQ